MSIGARTLQDVRGSCLTRKKQDAGRGTYFTYGKNCINAIEFGHDDVGQDDIRTLFTGKIYSTLTCIKCPGLKAVRRQDLDQAVCDRYLVVDHKDAPGAHFVAGLGGSRLPRFCM